MSRAGVVAILLGVLFTAYEGNEWMRQQVVAHSTPAGLALPAAECPADELEEEGLSVAECEQLVEDVRSYIVSAPAWFYGVQSWLAAIGTLLAIATIVGGAGLVNGRSAAAGFGVFVFGALALVDAGHFIAAQQAGPILRAIHLPVALLWFAIHISGAIACFVLREQLPPSALPSPLPLSADADADAAVPRVYGRFEVATHWFLAVSVFFLFVSSWWMLALPLPSDEMTYREFPFQLHKNLGISIVLLLVAMTLIRLRHRQVQTAAEAETALARKARIGGHVALYALLFAVCITGFMSSTYSGWSTIWWWLIELPYWGYENEELNQLYSDLHLWACWGLLLAMAAHIGAALLHAFRNDGMLRRILRW